MNIKRNPKCFGTWLGKTQVSQGVSDLKTEIQLLMILKKPIY